MYGCRATDVKVVATSVWDVIDGKLEHKVAEIPPQKNVTFTYVVRPNLPGRMVDTPARVEYRVAPGSYLMKGTSNSHVMFFVLSEQEYLGEYASQRQVYGAYALLSGLTVLVPFYLHRAEESRSGHRKQH